MGHSDSVEQDPMPNKHSEHTADQHTGYYVAGRDWPAISNNIPLQDIYRALEGINDDVVKAAMDSLKAVEIPSEGS